MAWFQIVSVLFIFITTINGQCQYDTASAVCFCNKEVYVREVRIVEVMSESCDCIIHLVDFNEPPTVTNMFDRECSWTCTNETCDHTEAWPTTRDSTTSDLKEAWPTTTVRVTTDSKEPHSEQKKDLGHYLQKMDVFMTVSGLFVAYVSLVVGKMLYRMRHQKLPYLPITRSQQDSTLTTQIPTLDITPSFELPTIIPVPEISTPQRPTVPRLRSIEDIPPIFTLRTYSSSSDTESFNRESSPEPSAPPMEDPTPPIARRTRSHRIKTPLTEETYM
ncbi:Hypothetical predicted protein [Mytilus galloprovincialis]|uniref:Uncharacterized protein n=1 Tax=Mytilus galloprovincialis TaxID=29158 RepID=A0A8B6F6V5_MYTGA|nr:Hypothetical predicted protein [Mytilus galloprovincialis]